MEIKRITDEQIDKLNEALPDEAVSPHPTKPYLSSIKAIYVTERLNEAFGHGAWTIKTDKESVDDAGMVVVKVTLEVPEYGFYYESFGGNDNGGKGSKNFDLGDAYKGATTDAITKIASYMGIGSDVFKGKQSGGSTKTKTQTQTKKKAGKSKDLTCPSCGLINESEVVRHGTTKTGAPYHLANCSCGESYFIDPVFFMDKTDYSKQDF